MKQYPLVQVGRPGFRKACSPYTKKEILSLAIKKQTVRMKYTIRAVHGVGVAAPQIGIQKQMFILRLTPTKYRPDVPRVRPYAVFNPKILSYSKKTEADWEGCFSVAKAGLFAKVTRPVKITVRYLNENAEVVRSEIAGIEARVFQHEFDHLYGKVFLEKEIDPSSLMSLEEYRAMRKRQSKHA